MNVEGGAEGGGKGGSQYLKHKWSPLRSYKGNQQIWGGGGGLSVFFFVKTWWGVVGSTLDEVSGDSLPLSGPKGEKHEKRWSRRVGREQKCSLFLAVAEWKNVEVLIGGGASKAISGMGRKKRIARRAPGESQWKTRRNRVLRQKPTATTVIGISKRVKGVS